MLISKPGNISTSAELIFTLGDENGKIFSRIFEKYYAALCLFAERIVGAENAEDVIEELFVTLWNKQHVFNDEEHLKAFLYHSAKNACLDFLRSDGRANVRNTKYAMLFDDTEESYLAEITRTETIRELHQAIDELSPQCRKVVRMGYFEGLSNAEIAEKLGVSVQTVKNQKAQAIALLRKRLPANKLLLVSMVLYYLQ
jgi:RNA polymerase sigma-70 factor (ECF subfamily)